MKYASEILILTHHRKTSELNLRRARADNPNRDAFSQRIIDCYCAEIAGISSAVEILSESRQKRISDNPFAMGK